MAIRTAAIFALFLFQASTAFGDIDYKVTIQTGEGTGQRMQVVVMIPVESASTQIQIPNWGPGGYAYFRTPWENIADLKATADGQEVETIKPNDYTWTIPTNRARLLTVTYNVPVQIAEEMGHYRGPSTYVYVVGRKEEKCNLQVDLPFGWNIATGLDGLPSNRANVFVSTIPADPNARKTPWKFSAPTYDVLADNPVTFGKYRELSYMVDGTLHILAMYGPARNDIDTDYLLKACSAISAMENDLFGNKPPYSHYVWHFNVGKRPDGGGGLEHLASTEITLANGLGKGIIGVNAHEFFHLWNVKRIRPFALGPFDYTKLPETGLLWWMEGITEYYAHQLLSRYQFFPVDDWYSTIVKNVTQVRANPAHLTVSPYEASFRVKDASNGRGNSNGYQISYYDLGVVAGICFDIEIISRTNGRKSLDDVERALWNECKNSQPGIPEDEIRNQMVRIAGPALGAMYDKIIMQPGDFPVEEELAKVGLTFQKTDHQVTDIGVTLRGRAVAVGAVSGPAIGKLKVGDVIQEVNGDATPTGGGYSAAVGKIKVGDTVNLKVKRGDDTLNVTLVAGTATKQSYEVQEDPNATPEQKRLREIWLFRGKKDWKAPAVK